MYEPLVLKKGDIPRGCELVGWLSLDDDNPHKESLVHLLRPGFEVVEPDRWVPVFKRKSDA